MVYENILEAVGNTPLIRLHHMTGEEDAQIFVKFEAVNVGASIKTRTALGMIKAAEREGKITKETIIVEPTSGNQGIGLALIGAVRGYRTIIIMPDPSVKSAESWSDSMERGPADPRCRKYRRMYPGVHGYCSSHGSRRSSYLCASAV